MLGLLFWGLFCARELKSSGGCRCAPNAVRLSVHLKVLGNIFGRQITYFPSALSAQRPSYVELTGFLSYVCSFSKCCFSLK